MIISTRYIRGMTQNHLIRIRTLIERLAKITTAVDWQDGLNPAQYNALSYLALANRYSRSPSHVADYLCTTRGTASQTLKSLEQKGFIHSVASATDKRSTTYQMTDAGQAIANATHSIDQAIATMDDTEQNKLETTLKNAVSHLLAHQNRKSFGLCHTCIHNETTDNSARCKLLGIALTPEDTQKICHEHSGG